MLYFAYGSNLSIARLQQRVPSSRLVATGRLRRHSLVFHKIGRDGSAKCNAYYTGNPEDYTLGAVYSIAPSHKPLLDKAEGLGNGYEIKHVTVMTDTGAEFSPFLYSATEIDRHRKPFHWYKEHVLRGMREHGFPAQYLSRAAAVESIADNDSARTERELQIYSQDISINFLTGGGF
ncbi:MAG: gamma-glutamylcyclotransferase [Desulfobulbaceae bacterium]|nr:gamma-glutamylcyclotransferase [Desulfobulbaceae bacterium]